MCKSSISLEVKLWEVEYIEENIIVIPVYLKQKDTGKEFSRFNKFLKFNGQVWQTIDDKEDHRKCDIKLLKHEKHKRIEYYNNQIKRLEEELKTDRYFELNQAIKQIDLELSNNKTYYETDKNNSNRIQEIKEFIISLAGSSEEVVNIKRKLIDIITK